MIGRRLTGWVAWRLLQRLLQQGLIIFTLNSLIFLAAAAVSCVGPPFIDDDYDNVYSSMDVLLVGDKSAERSSQAVSHA